MPDVTITFDGRSVKVPEGTNLVEAGLAVDVSVPVFCYQKDLGAVGACRVCAVTTTVQGRSRMVMACMTQAADGMAVTTLDPQSREFRRWVLEWLMVNHPHDCPICDEGGECQLQDLTVAAGQSVRRYRGPKRTFPNQYLGEFISHEMNRCITCYRCTRFYRDYAGGKDFAESGSRDRVYFGRFQEGAFESPFSGNLVEFCPTGVFTDKTFRYRSRVWDLEIHPSICPHCSVGCSLSPGSRHRELQRVRMRDNPAVNGVFICDRGQFGHFYTQDPERPRAPKIRGVEVAWDEALGLAGARLLAIARDKGADKIAFVTSSRASLETMAALRALGAEALAGARIALFDSPGDEERTLAAVAALASAKADPLEPADLARADAALIAGTSLVDEAPVAALQARQVGRNGGKLFVFNAGERYLNDVASVEPVHPARCGAALRAVAEAIARGAPVVDAAEAAAAALLAAERPAIVVGTDLMDADGIAAGAAVARALIEKGKRPRLGFVLRGPNGFGAAAMQRTRAIAGIIDDLRAGTLSAVVLAEADLADLGSDVLEALGKLELLVVADYLAGSTAQRATVLLPTTVTYESDGTFVNRAGRAQAFEQDASPGIAVGRLIAHQNGKDDFPRKPSRIPPGGDLRPAWWVLEQLRQWAVGKPAARSFEAVRATIAAEHAFWEPLAKLEAGSEGAPLDASALAIETAPFPAFASPGHGLAGFRVERVLGSEVLSRHSPPLMRTAGAPAVELSPADAQRLGLPGRIAIAQGSDTIEVDARARAGIPEGVVLIPREIPWPRGFRQGSAVEVQAATPAGARA